MKRIYLFLIPAILISICTKAQTDSVLSKKFWSIGVRTLHPSDFTMKGVLFTPEAGYNFRQHEMMGGVIIRTYFFSTSAGIHSSPFTGGIFTYRYFLKKRVGVLQPYASYEMIYCHSWHGAIFTFSGQQIERKWIDTYFENFLLIGAHVYVTKFFNFTLASGYGMSTHTHQETYNGMEDDRDKRSRPVSQFKIGIEYNLVAVYRKPKKSLN